MIIPRNNDPNYGKYLDLNMLVLYTGRERTEAEYRKLFEATGFALAQPPQFGQSAAEISGRTDA